MSPSPEVHNVNRSSSQLADARSNQRQMTTGVGMFYVMLITASANDDTWQAAPHTEGQISYRTREALLDDFRSNTGIVPTRLREGAGVPSGVVNICGRIHNEPPEVYYAILPEGVIYFEIVQTN